MADFDQQVRQAIYAQTIQAAVPPTSTEVSRLLGRPPSEIKAAFQRLAASHALALQPESGEILMAGPFSAVPTAFAVSVGQQTYYGNCIWDAFGVQAMLRQDAVIQTSCPCCGMALTIEARGGGLSAPPSVVHFALPAARWWDDIVLT